MDVTSYVTVLNRSYTHEHRGNMLIVVPGGRTPDPCSYNTRFRGCYRQFIYICLIYFRGRM